MNSYNPISPLANARGSVIVAALLLLVVATIIGVAALTTSSTERQTSANFMVYERAFYTAEAGLEHVKEGLRSALKNEERMRVLATTGRADWTFTLTPITEHEYRDGTKRQVRVWIEDQPLDDIYRYTVTIWDNDDGDGDTTKDTDGIIFVRADAAGPWNSSCSVETMLEADLIEDPVSGYSQYGGDHLKGFQSIDRNAVDVGELIKADGKANFQVKISG